MLAGPLEPADHALADARLLDRFRVEQWQKMVRIPTLLIQESPWHRVVVAAFHLVRSLDGLVENGRIRAIISVTTDVPSIKWIRDLAFWNGLGFGFVKSLEWSREGERQGWQRREVDIEASSWTNTRCVVARVHLILAVATPAAADENCPPEQTDDEAYGG